jgi:sulfonate transport system substrate-binding protein
MGDVEPGVDIARGEYKAHNIFVEGRDLDFQIDFNSWLVRTEFAKRNHDLVLAINAAVMAEAEWASLHHREAEAIAQKQGHYSDGIRDMFVAWKRQYHLHGVDDHAFLAGLQQAADWLSAREVLPQAIRVRDHLAVM